MFNLKKLAAIATAALLMAGGANARELQLGHVAPKTTPWDKAFNGFAALVNQLSSGKLTVKIFPAAQLGQEQEMVRQMARGRIDIVSVSNTAMSLLVPEIGLLSAPYIFSTPEQSDCTYDKLSDTFRAPLAKAGAVALGWFEVGHMIVLTKEKLAKSPTELAGEKIRSAPTASDTLYLKEVGAIPVPLNVAETMQGLQTGAISGATFPTIFAIAAGIAQTAPQVSVTNHVHQVGGMMISNETWKTLSAEEQGWLNEAAAKALAGLRQGIRQAEGALLKKAEAGGAVIYRPNEGEMKAWRAAAKTSHPKIVSEYGGNAETVWATIEKTASACAK